MHKRRSKKYQNMNLRCQIIYLRTSFIYIYYQIKSIRDAPGKWQ